MDNQIKVLADAPSKADLLGHSSYVNALYRIITSESTFTPFNIGVLGEWGTGKSTLMMQLASNLAEENFPVVIFNPWRYDDKEEIVHALIQTILFSFEKEEGKKELKDMAIGIAKGLGQMVLSKLVSTATLETVDFDKVVQIYSEKKSENIKFINEFEVTFTELVSKHAGDKKLVIFIDDLDRCMPDNIIKVLESIKLFLSVPKTVFVIGIDNGVIQEAITEKYGKHYKFSGKDYLEKIIQLSFSIPSPADKNIEDFVMKICGGSLKADTVKLIISGCKSNPRRIKRFINAFNLISAVIDEELSMNMRAYPLNKDLLSLVLLLQIQFPLAYNYYMMNSKDCSDLLLLLSSGEFYDKEQIERIKTANPVYGTLLDNKELTEFLKKTSTLGISFDLRDEGLSEYFSATKTIQVESQVVDSYYLPEIVKGKAVLFNVGKDLHMISSGQMKLNVVKTVKELTGVSLKEAKDLVDFAPSIILENVPREKQQEYKRLLEEAGATVEYR